MNAVLLTVLKLQIVIYHRILPTIVLRGGSKPQNLKTLLAHALLFEGSSPVRRREPTRTYARVFSLRTTTLI